MWAPTHTQGLLQSPSLWELRPWEKSQPTAVLLEVRAGTGLWGQPSLPPTPVTGPQGYTGWSQSWGTIDSAPYGRP